MNINSNFRLANEICLILEGEGVIIKKTLRLPSPWVKRDDMKSSHLDGLELSWPNCMSM